MPITNDNQIWIPTMNLRILRRNSKTVGVVITETTDTLQQQWKVLNGNILDEKDVKWIDVPIVTE